MVVPALAAPPVICLWGDVSKPEVMRHMIENNNLGLVAVRQTSSNHGSWQHVLVGSGLVEGGFISNRTKEINYVFPLKLVPDGKLVGHVKPNISDDFISEVETASG